MKLGLDKQIYIYSLDTSAFYNELEQTIHKKLLKSYRYREYLKSLDQVESRHKKYISKRISFLKTVLHNSFNKYKERRELRLDALKDNNVISIFDSTLTRTLDLPESTLTEDILVVQSYYYKVLESLIKNGFLHKDEKYIYFTSSAGQIRTKKSVFIKESIWNEYQNTLTCGLSIVDINKQGGSNVNKYLSYLALSNSASFEWSGFNIDRAIVVDDLETEVISLVDYINRDTYQITRQEMNIPIEHTDGCGMVLPKKNKKSFMCRLPWLKGLLVPFPFDKFAEQYQTFKVKDIYGKEWDIQKDKIEIIFTKSQFKMWKYYSSWEEYKEKFKTYKCQAAKLNEEDTTANAVLNYQMLQTLTDITDDELKDISKQTSQDILQIGSDKETMLRVLGATETNKRKNYFQQVLLMYPELLNDPHSKQVIKDKKKSLVKDAKSGKLEINGKYTFLCPDLYAFCERLFLGIESPNGLLSKEDVYCRIFEEGKVDCLRSPHLYREHAVRNNVLDDRLSEWFTTNGVYTSVHDPISKMLQFDNDGDKALVVQDKTLVEVAERNMEGIVPLYYEMAKAEAEEINSDSIYKSLILAYKANIGEISNNITKIWNSDNVDLDVIKWLCMENNFTIDFAKTLYMPERPEPEKTIITKYIKEKVPHFFIHAKDKEKNRVSELNSSVVNRLETVIPNKPIRFQKIAGKINYKILLHDKKVQLNDEIIKRYTELDRSKKFTMNSDENVDSSDTLYMYKYIRDELLKINQDILYLTDVLVLHLYKNKKSAFKTTLWSSFGDILLENITKNLENTKQCDGCGKRIHIESNRKTFCEKCWKTYRAKYKAEKEKEYRRKKKERGHLEY